MTENTPNLKVAVVQAAPILFGPGSHRQKSLPAHAGSRCPGCENHSLPEAFIPAYPRGLTFGTVVGSRTPQGRAAWQVYWEGAVEIPSPATAALGEASPPGADLPGNRSYRARHNLQWRHAVLHPALFQPAGRAARQAPQAQAHRRRAPDLGRGRRQHVDRGR